MNHNLNILFVATELDSLIWNEVIQSQHLQEQCYVIALGQDNLERGFADIEYLLRNLSTNYHLHFSLYGVFDHNELGEDGCYVLTEHNVGKEALPVQCCTLATLNANSILSSHHDRIQLTDFLINAQAEPVDVLDFLNDYWQHPTNYPALNQLWTNLWAWMSSIQSK